MTSACEITGEQYVEELLRKEESDPQWRREYSSACRLIKGLGIEVEFERDPFFPKTVDSETGTFHFEWNDPN